MGTQVSAIFEASKPINAINIRNFMKDWFNIKKERLLLTFNASLDTPFEWKGSSSLFPETTKFTINGPFGIQLDFMQSGLAMIHCGWIRWSDFVFNTGAKRDLFQETLTALASHCGGRIIAYVPDSAFPASGGVSLVDEGASMAEIVEWLRNNVGPPTESQRVLSPTSSIHECYFIQRLS